MDWWWYTLGLGIGVVVVVTALGMLSERVSYILMRLLAALGQRIVGVYVAWAGSYALGYAIALPSKEWPAISTWIIVAGNVPFVLAILLAMTSPLWGRRFGFRYQFGSDEAQVAEGAPEDSQRADAYSNMAEQDADESGEARGAANLVQPPRIVSWALRRNRDTETCDE